MRCWLANGERRRERASTRCGYVRPFCLSPCLTRFSTLWLLQKITLKTKLSLPKALSAVIKAEARRVPVTVVACHTLHPSDDTAVQAANASASSRCSVQVAKVNIEQYITFDGQKIG
jgi:hypothetical protein